MTRTLLCLLLAMPAVAQPVFVSSPDGRVAVRFGLDDVGAPTYAVDLGGQPILEPSPLGLVTTLARWDRDLTVAEAGEVESVEDRYRLVHGKQSDVTYTANRRSVRLGDAAGRVLEVVFQVSDDGVAFRYRIPEQAEAGEVTARREVTGFRFDPATRSWLMPMTHPQTGWMNTNPSYEALYTQGEPVGGEAPNEVGWAFPGLFQTAAGWALVTEAGLDGSYVGSRLDADADRGLYRIAFPDAGEGTGPDDPVDPTFALPFGSPWRVVIVGETLAPIVESTLVTDVSPASVVEDTSWIRPGSATWSWLPLKDPSMNPAEQREFVDFAADRGFPYTLVDANWDVELGYDGLAELADHAASRGVDLLVWYNSNGPYNGAPQTPKDKLNDPETRRAEFARLREMGVRGIKADFFGGDKQSVIRLYLDILRDAADYGLMVNVHGATLPRGWSRTYPHFVTAEAVMGYEYITFSQGIADAAPQHGAVLPFTRNVVGPMDFTPVMLTDTVGGSVRRTSDAYDLAMMVVFESGVQHLGVTPADLAAAPDFVSEFLSTVPTAWDETRFVEGFPGETVVIARRKGDRWYVGGLNGTAAARSVRLDLPFLPAGWRGALIADGDGARDVRQHDTEAGDVVEMRPAGGFVVIVEPPE
ncbi:glycoside hydrolase family 97 protein [Rubrivirga marina]|uniref:Alpha-glucosidase n=1 Tax=Rubrivirga marina TaxID=1196024 RepID=A0A271IW56_9BACT|nr:glycoside hydrolase family 97 protein [Rubrivirga marina]PAP75034.1 hypothetical protein BSZ37_00495 [Rubrivirga marina]